MKRNLVIVAVILAVLFALGFRVAHPQGGLESALGSAKSSLVVYRGADSFKVGDKVVFHIVSESSEADGTTTSTDRTYLGAVISSSESAGIGVEAKEVRTQINAEDLDTTVKGKMMFVVPFFGTLAGLVGL
jgi:hypothetical protein